ncbi:MAG: potassium channel family protein [Owenweeksia sp.]
MAHVRVLRKLYVTALILFILITVGVVGFIVIEGYNLSEAIYMTILTLSTVGFNEVHPLSAAGRAFTSILIISSFGTFAYGISVISRSILTGELGQYLKQYRLEKNIENINDHTIICGYGRNGRRAAKKLKAYGQKFVVIENNENIIDQYLRDQNVLYLRGDATVDEVLEAAGARTARCILATLSKDADNLYVVVTVRSINPDVRIISRASSESAERKLKTAGAHAVVMPEGVGGAHMATLVVSPHIVEFLDFISIEGSSRINLEEIEVSQLTDGVEGVKIKDLQLRQKTGCSIIGLRTPEGEYRINPGGDLSLTHNSKLFVLGNPEEIKTLYKILNE